MRTQFVKAVALKAGYVLGSLKANASVPNWFTAIVAAKAESLGTIEARFAPDLETALLRETGNVYRVEVNDIQKTEHLMHFTFVIVRPDQQSDEFLDESPGNDRRLGGDASSTKLPALGSVVKSASGYTGQIVAYSKDVPRLIKVRWHKPNEQRGIWQEFDTWENPLNQEVIQQPVGDQWWPKEKFIPSLLPSSDIGTPLNELLSPERELSPDDAAYHSIMDAEAKQGPKDRVQLKPWTGAMRKCACGCGGMTLYVFCMGHDSRAKGLLQRKRAGTEPRWIPSAELIAHIETHKWWYDQFGEFVQQFKEK